MAVQVALVVQGVLALLIGALYLYVGRLVLQRHPSEEARRANALFALWWVGLGLVQAAAGALNLGLSLGFDNVALVVTFVDVVLVVICAALWGLTYYLAYLYTGRRGLLWPLAVFYGGLGIAFLYLIAWMQPTGLEDTAFTTTLAYARRPPPAVSMALGAALAVPVVLAAFAYGTLFFRVRERAQRFRIAVVSGSFLGWFGWSLVSTFLQLNVRYRDELAFIALNQTISLLVPLLIILAFRPPAWLRRRLAEPGAPAA